MTFEDLPDFINNRRKNDDLLEIEDEIDPYLELTWFLNEEERVGRGKTILFNHVKGSDIPVVGNIFSTHEKMNAILGDTPENVGMGMRNLIRPPKESESLIGRGLEMLKELGGLRPKLHDRLPSSYRILDTVDLTKYPFCTTWPDDAAPFLTLPVVITKDPETGMKNAGMYRMQMYDSETMGMHWQIHKDGSRHYQDYKEKGKIMDVSVTLGTDPLTIFSSVAPLPEPLDEFSFSGLISKKRADLVKGQTVDMHYPMNSEIVLEGYVDTSETRIEGPFGDHTGYYSLSEEFPVFHVRKIVEKKNPIYPTTIVGKLWHEDVIMGKAIERLFLPLVRLQIPEIVDMNTLEEAVFHDMIVVSIKKRYPGHAKKVMFAIWGTGQLMFSKIVLIVDDDIDVHDRKQVIWAMGTRIDPSRDVVIIPGTHTDTLDHAASLLNYGSKMGIDATKKWKSEGFNRPWPDTLSMKKDIQERVEQIRKKMNLSK
ncbi:MAG: menaquinone biosynthesis decarboxylase [Cuniculiplasma sp.]